MLKPCSGNSKRIGGGPIRHFPDTDFQFFIAATGCEYDRYATVSGHRPDSNRRRRLCFFIGAGKFRAAKLMVRNSLLGFFLFNKDAAKTRSHTYCHATFKHFPTKIILLSKIKSFHASMQITIE